jgi:predicted dehydrogenase
MAKVRIGIIGTGVGLRTLFPGFKMVADAEIIALSGSSIDRTRFFASEFGIPIACESYLELCMRNDIDLVCVTSPNPFHFEHTKAALDNKKNVLCEKPFTLKRTDMEYLIARHKELGVLGLIDHQLRFNPYIVKIRDFLRSGLIGKPYFVQIHQQSTSFSDNNAKWSWSFDAEQGGGIRYGMFSHFADLLNFWFHSDYYNLSASLNPVYTERIDCNGKKRAVLASTFCKVSFELSGKLSVILSATAGACGHPSFDVNVYGDKGEIHFDLTHKITLYTLEKKGIKKEIDLPDVYTDEKENKISIFSGSFRYFAPQIIRAINEGNPLYVEYASQFEDAKYTFDFLEAIKESANNSVLINPLETESNYV